MENVVEPALQELSANQLDQPVSQEVFFQEFRKFLGIIALRLQQHPVIVAHTENTFDGSGIRRLLSNKFEFDKVRTIWQVHLSSLASFTFLMSRQLYTTPLTNNIYHWTYCSCWILYGDTFRKNTKIKLRRSTSGLRLIGLRIRRVSHLLEQLIRYVAEPFMLSVAPSQALSMKRWNLLK